MARTPQHFVVFGVSGSGKTTVARKLAEDMGRDFVDADDFHTAESIRKMSAGIPLTSSDREPWLRSIRQWMDDRAAEGRNTAVACSALKRAYRDQLREATGGVMFIFLTGPRETIKERLAARQEHFMPVSLLESQFNALEPLADDEGGVAVDVRSPVDAIVDQVRGEFSLAS